ncbi:MAG: hypothetical protein F2667_00135 [Actinobacteria bacterium]|uniref:Unannotated protein n=1 Tax=freshwater metagenome TaxID=449393 RepID=A0A6J6NDS6_9ZZZZ|nr:hypothetical protein [Actinomycetota bacterium]
MRSKPPARVLLGLRVVKVALVGMLMSLLIGLHAQATPADQAPVADPFADTVDQLMSANRCSFTGFGPTEIPASALLRVSTDQVRVVSFERGWAAYEGTKPGTLVAVCLGPRVAGDH